MKQTDKKTVVLTTSPQTAGVEYTVSVNGNEFGKFTGISAVIPTKVELVSTSVQGKLGQQVTVQAKVTVAAGQSAAGIPVTFNATSNNPALNAAQVVEAVTNADGVATYTYTRYAAGNDTVVAYSTGDRSKFSTGYVFWGVEQILKVEEVTTGSTINNNSNKTYKVTYTHPTTGKVVANKELNVSFIENINVAPNVAKNATVNGVAVQQLTNNTVPKTAVITTDSKGEATFTVSGANTEVTPVVFDLNTDRSHGTEYASYYEADLLQVTAPKVKFSALQAEYSIELTRDGGEYAAFGSSNGRKYKVLVKDKNGAVAKNEIVNVAFNEDLDRVISTNTNAKFVEIDADGRQVGFYGTTPKNGNTEDKITVKTNDKGEASFVIGSESGNTNDYATPVAWIDINSSNAKDGQLDEGEPTKVGQISYFEAAKLTGGKLVSTDSNGDAEDQFEGNESAYFEFQLTNQSGKKIALDQTGGYDVITATYTLTNTGDQDVLVESTVNGRTVEQTVSPNRDYTVTVDAVASPKIAVKPANSEKSASVKVTANAIVKDNENVLKQFTINSTSETKVSFKGTKEVGNLEKGIIESFNTDKQTFTIAGKNPVKYAGVAGKTFVYRDLDNRPVSLANFEKALKDATQAVEITYEVKGDETTFYLKSVSGDAPIDTVEASATDATVSSIKVKNVAATGSGSVYNVVLPVGTDLSTLTATDVVVTPTNSGAKVAAATTSNGGATWTVVVTAANGTTTATYTVNASVEVATFKLNSAAYTAPTVTEEVVSSGTFQSEIVISGNAHDDLVNVEFTTGAATTATYTEATDTLAVVIAAGASIQDVITAINTTAIKATLAAGATATDATTLSSADDATLTAGTAEVVNADAKLALTFSEAVTVTDGGSINISLSDATTLTGTVASGSNGTAVVTVTGINASALTAGQTVTVSGVSGVTVSGKTLSVSPVSFTVTAPTLQ